MLSEAWLPPWSLLSEPFLPPQESKEHRCPLYWLLGWPHTCVYVRVHACATSLAPPPTFASPTLHLAPCLAPPLTFHSWALTSALLNHEAEV